MQNYNEMKEVVNVYFLTKDERRIAFESSVKLKVIYVNGKPAFNISEIALKRACNNQIFNNIFAKVNELTGPINLYKVFEIAASHIKIALNVWKVKLATINFMRINEINSYTITYSTDNCEYYREYINNLGIEKYILINGFFPSKAGEKVHLIIDISVRYDYGKTIIPDFSSNIFEYLSETLSKYTINEIQNDEWWYTTVSPYIEQQLTSFFRAYDLKIATITISNKKTMLEE